MKIAVKSLQAAHTYLLIVLLGILSLFLSQSRRQSLSSPNLRPLGRRPKMQQNKFKVGLLLAVLLGVMLFAPAVDASIVWLTKGTGRVGNLCLGSTTFTSTGTEVNTLHDEIATVDQISTAGSAT